LLELINACLSHEFRNPLNSLVALNIEKRQLYNELERILRNLNSTDEEIT